MTDGPDDRLAKDLLRERSLEAHEPPGDRTVSRLDARGARRPAGNSTHLWERVAGEDPFRTARPQPLARRTVYADGRFVRLDQEAKDAARATRGERAKPPPMARNDGFTGGPPARAGGNAGESLIPPGFRNLPSSSPKAKVEAPRPAQGDASKTNLGESLIPEGFRDLPVAKPPAPPRPKQTPTGELPPIVGTPKPPSNVTRSGRMRTAPARRRQVVRRPRTAEATPTAPTPPAPTPEATPPAPPTPPTAPAPPAEPPRPAPSPGPPPAADVGLDDLFSAPREGRARMSRRARPTPTRKTTGGPEGDE